jgi:carbon-monoxide dehydrogenase medium subunit
VKPAPFAYQRVDSVDEAVDALGSADGDGRILAGGQSLVPMLNMRLLQPSLVVDVNELDGLSDITETETVVEIGALTRYCTIEWSPTLGSRLPLLTEIVRYIGDRQIRSRGTVGGSLAQADPTGEMPLAALALDATVVVAGGGGRSREVSVDDLLEGAYSTSLEPDEMITHVRFPVTDRSVSAVVEHARRHGDFCVIGVAAVGEPDNGGWKSVRLALAGVSDRPFVPVEANAILSGGSLEADAVDAACQACVEAADPSDDIRASADYRLNLIPIYVKRALALLAARRSEGAK